MKEDAERKASMEEALAEYRAGKRTDLNISLIRKSYHLDGIWWEWECEIEFPDGSIRDGLIESDGHIHTIETLRLE